MTEYTDAAPAPLSESWLFFRRWLADPRAMGSIAPSSPALRRRITREIRREADEVVVEFGGGTGPITKAMLEAGIPADRLYSFEIDQDLARHLRARCPDVTVIVDDCRKAPGLLGETLCGKVGTVVIGIPMITFPLEFQREVLDATFRILRPGGRFLLYSFMPHSPLNREALGLSGERLGFTLRNLPPASVWGYWRG
ncbi:phospholipid methyltransferase [Azospirillum sp. TSH100]|uniref:class I SAM-dependent methyltransferase n=1 Tax=Azospirillum sp. TSH100 TaxID=652764 RepID=UPI000D613E28|nr:methyltransferase domain-containing protein [Azospirillum sp. TSH100]PWC86479.1 phospholipid methyltransferase [Azospirillum sp. TSH100]QCG88395.1 methyltransferase domain-containing protein [Azospirillum sp. TSH100]